jgi:hypothetical protein
MRTFQPSLRGALATKQSSFSFCGGDGLLRSIEGALDWLAMTSQDMHAISPILSQAFIRTRVSCAEGRRRRWVTQDEDREPGTDRFQRIGRLVCASSADPPTRDF